MNGSWSNILARYGFAVFLAMFLLFLVRLEVIGYGVIGLAYLSVFLAARFGGRGPGNLASALLTALTILITLKSGKLGRSEVITTILLFAASGPTITTLVEDMKKARRLAESNAREAARHGERLRTTLQSIGDAVIVTDGRGLVVSLNPVAEALTGWLESDAKGRPFAGVLTMVHEESRQPVESPIPRVLRENTVVGLPEHSILIARDGTERPIDDSAAPIRNHAGEIDGIVMVFRDVSIRREAAIQLAQAESRFRAFMDRSPVVAFIKDGEGRYVWGNQAWIRQSPAFAEGGVGKTDEELWPEATARLFRHSDQEVLKSNVGRDFIEQSADAHGSVVHWMTMKFPLGQTSPHKLIGGIAVDVTERVHHEKTIRDSEARYRLLFESNPHPMWLVDSQTDMFLAANEAAVAHYGYSVAEFLSMTVFDIRPTDELPQFREWLAENRHARTTTSRWRQRKKDGAIIEVETASHAIEFEGRAARVVLANDVTERRKAELALGISRERLDLVINGAELGLWYCDLPSGELTLNDRAKTHFGLDPNVPLDLVSALKLAEPEDRGRIQTAIDGAIQNQELFDIVHRVPIDGAPPRWVRVIGRAFIDASGRPARFDGISIDVTAQKRGEEQLREAKEAAVDANNAKSKFLAMLGHELRTPLTPVLASVSALLDYPEHGAEGWSTEEVRSLLTMIRRNIELESRLINDLLDISRFERGQLRLDLERVDVHEAIRQAVDVCRDAILVSGLQVDLQFHAGHQFVNGDHARLMQIVWNLVHNAAKFAPTAGKLEIRTSSIPDAEQVARKVIVEFIDNGIGIEAELLPLIFDPFEQGTIQSKSRHSGLGLGLAISRSIAEAHGGRLTADSAGRGHGTSFRLELDALRRVDPIRAAPALDVRSIERSAGRILLVEDNIDTLRYLAILLRQRGFLVETARRFEEAEFQLESHSYDVLISDIQLPDGSGLDLMRQKRGKLVGIAVSGFGSDSDVVVSLEAGFASHLTKPIDMNRLEAAIQDGMMASRR